MLGFQNQLDQQENLLQLREHHLFLSSVAPRPIPPPNFTPLTPVIHQNDEEMEEVEDETLDDIYLGKKFH